MGTKIYRWINDAKEVCEYRFTDDKCDGFFVDDKPWKTFPIVYKGEKWTSQWGNNLEECGFKLVT